MFNWTNILIAIFFQCKWTFSIGLEIKHVLVQCVSKVVHLVDCSESHAYGPISYFPLCKARGE